MMATATTSNSSLAKKAEEAKTPAKVTAREAITQIIDRNKGAIGASLPSGMTQERFARLLLTAANTNPALFDCDPRSFLAAGVFAAQLGLEPNDPRGLAYLVPFADKDKGKVVVFIPGYRGLMELARRSGMVSTIHAFPVYQGDAFEYSFGLEPTLKHVPSDVDDPAKLTHVYAVAKVNGDPQFVVLTRKQVEKAKAASRGSSSKFSPWNTHYVEMAQKTAIRRLCKYLPQTVEMAQVTANEEQIVSLGDTGVSLLANDDDVLDVSEANEPKLEAGKPEPTIDASSTEVAKEEVGDGTLLGTETKTEGAPK
jgi:recombination protein RecT